MAALNELRTGTLGVAGIAFFVIAAAAPLTAMAGGAPVAMLLGNGSGVPGAYVLVVLILLVFAAGYTAMARHHTNTGAFYSFITHGIGPRAGRVAAVIALLAYNSMQIGLYGLFGAAVSGLLGGPWYLYSFGALILIAFLGYRQVDLSMKVLAALVLAEFAIVLVLDAVIFERHDLSLEPFSPSALVQGALPIALLFNFASFVGFEATAIYGEEARSPRTTVPRATYLALLVIGVFYTLTTFLLVNAAGDVSAFVASLPDPTQFLFSISDDHLGGDWTAAMRILFVTSVFAALLAFHNAVARYVFALGRDGLLPSAMSRTHPRFQSPHHGSLAQSALAAVVVGLFVVSGQDPVLALFAWLTNLGTLGVVILMSATSVAVALFFRGRREGVWRTLVAPIVSAVLLAGVAVVTVLNFSLLV